MISWFSKKQSIVSLSTAEAEYIASCFACCEAMWLRKLMSGLFEMELDTTIILRDSQSCINMTQNPMFHDKSKNMKIQIFYIRDMVQKGSIKIQCLSTDDQVVDVLTMPLCCVKFEYLCDKIGVVKNDFPHKEEQ